MLFNSFVSVNKYSLNVTPRPIFCASLYFSAWRRENSTQERKLGVIFYKACSPPAYLIKWQIRL